MSTAATTNGSARRESLRRRLDRIKGDGWGDVLFVPAVLLALVLYLSYANEFFATELNITNIFLQAATLAVVAFGLSFVIFAGELDLSVGAGVALVSVVASTVMRDTGSIPLGVLTCLGVGATVGLINGLIVTKLKVPSFIATFGMLTIAQGIALAMTDRWRVRGDHTYTVARDATTNLELLRRPRNSGSLRASFVRGPLTINADARIVGIVGRPHSVRWLPVPPDS